MGTDPTEPDTDNDGLPDGTEVQTHRTRPDRADSDGGGQGDGAEVALGQDPGDPRDDLPAAPTRLRVHRLDSRGAELTWSPAPTTLPAGFVVYSRSAGSLNRLTPQPAAACRVVLDQLPADTDLTLHVRATTPDGREGPLSTALRLRLASLDPARDTDLSLDGARLHLPAGALAAKTWVGIATSPVPSGPSSTGTAFEFLPHGTPFLHPVTVTLPIAGADASAAELAGLQAGRFAGDRWIPLEDPLLAEGGTALRGTTLRFSAFDTYAAGQEIRALTLRESAAPEATVLTGHVETRTATPLRAFWKVDDRVRYLWMEYHLELRDADCTTKEPLHWWSRPRVWKLVVERDLVVRLNPQQPGFLPRAQLKTRVWVDEAPDDAPLTPGQVLGETTRVFDTINTPDLRILDATELPAWWDGVQEAWDVFDLPLAGPAVLGLGNGRCYAAQLVGSMAAFWKDIPDPIHEARDWSGLGDDRFPPASALIRTGAGGSSAPSLADALPAGATQDQPFTFRVQARSNYGNSLRFAGTLEAVRPATVQPDGAVSWLPANGDVKTGGRLTVTATDSRGNHATRQFILPVRNVNDPPTLRFLSATPKALVPRGPWGASDTAQVEVAIDDPDLVTGTGETHALGGGSTLGWFVRPGEPTTTGRATLTVEPRWYDQRPTVPQPCDLTVTVTDAAGVRVPVPVPASLGLHTKYWGLAGTRRVQVGSHEVPYVAESGYTAILKADQSRLCVFDSAARCAANVEAGGKGWTDPLTHDVYFVPNGEAGILHWQYWARYGVRTEPVYENQPVHDWLD